MHELGAQARHRETARAESKQAVESEVAAEARRREADQHRLQCLRDKLQSIRERAEAQCLSEHDAVQRMVRIGQDALRSVPQQAHIELPSLLPLPGKGGPTILHKMPGAEWEEAHGRSAQDSVLDLPRLLAQEKALEQELELERKHKKE